MGPFPPCFPRCPFCSPGAGGYTRAGPAWRAAATPVTVVLVRGVPWWGVVSAAVAPVLMVTGWTVAAHLQPYPFDAVSEPVSALAAVGATDRWLMSLTFLVVGACDCVTALALRPARVAGRLTLVAAAAAGVLVALNPERPGVLMPVPHMIWSAAGCLALVAWPVAASRRGDSVPWALRPAVAAAVVAVLFALVAWFAVELASYGGQAGLAERIFGIAQGLWLLAVVVSCRRAAGYFTVKPGISRVSLLKPSSTVISNGTSASAVPGFASSATASEPEAQTRNQ
jgi:hypothetical protein